MNPYPSPTRFSGKERSILFTLLGAGFVFAADYSILNVALPQVGAGAEMDASQLPWIVSAYTLPAAGFMLLFGRLADLFGRRRLFLAGMLLLAGASLLGGFASSPGLLLAARALQGTSTAIAIPAGLSLITTTFPEGALRDRALGLNAAIMSGGFAAGALAGGAIVSSLGWRAAFFVNVPIAAAVILLTLWLIPESKVPDQPRLDLPGAVTVTGGLLAVVYAVLEHSLLSAILGVGLLTAFWSIETRSPAPLAPVRILKRPTVKWGNYAGLVIFSMETGMIFLLTLYLQEVLELSPLMTGLIFGAPGLASIAAGPVAGRIIGRFGTRSVVAIGLTLQGLTILPLVFIGSDQLILAIVVPALFLGFFVHVTCIVAYMVIGTSGLPDGEQGLATGLTSMTQQVAVTVGAPVMVSIAATQSGDLTGVRVALAVNVAVTIISAAAIWFGLRPRTEAQISGQDQHGSARMDASPSLAQPAD